MNLFARFDENPAMTLRVIKETKRYGRTHGRTHGQRENSIPPTNKVCGGYNNFIFDIHVLVQMHDYGYNGQVENVDPDQRPSINGLKRYVFKGNYCLFRK